MMDQQFLDRERELFKLNAKLNAKSKKIAAATKQAQIRVQIHTANNNLNYYAEDTHTKGDTIVMMGAAGSGGGDEQRENVELMCKKLHIKNQPVKKPQEIAYPLFNRQTSTSVTGRHSQMIRRVDIHMPTSSLISDGQADEAFGLETITESTSFLSESMITRHSDDTSPAVPIINVPPLPPPPTDIIPKCIEKKISNDGLMKFLKSKVAILQTELEAGKNLNDTLEKENTKNTRKIKKLQTHVDKSNAKIDSLESSLKSIEEKYTSADETLKDKDGIITELNRELSAIKEEFKELNHNHQVIEKKLLKTQDDHDMMKSKYESYKDIEMIMRDSAKEERIAYEEKIRKLRKGRMDLLKAYKQQIILIDNLRRQNICLEKAKALEIAEKEFLKVLDWNFADK